MCDSSDQEEVSMLSIKKDTLDHCISSKNTLGIASGLNIHDFASVLYIHLTLHHMS